jgi:hypothetical protein
VKLVKKLEGSVILQFWKKTGKAHLAQDASCSSMEAPRNEYTPLP